MGQKTDFDNMGRKSLDKKRKERNTKTQKWAEDLLPKLQSLSLKDITMDELAKLIGKSKSTVYEYFKTKGEILQYVAEIRVANLEQYRVFSNSNEPDFQHQYQQLIDLICKGAQGISSHFLHELQMHYPDAWSVIRQYLDHLLEDIRKIYQLGIQNKVFHPVSVELLINLDEHFATNMITNESFLKDHQIPLETLVKDYLFLKFNGLNMKFQ